MSRERQGMGIVDGIWSRRDAQAGAAVNKMIKIMRLIDPSGIGRSGERRVRAAGRGGRSGGRSAGTAAGTAGNAELRPGPR